jgi:hypothetical protein
MTNHKLASTYRPRRYNVWVGNKVAKVYTHYKAAVAYAKKVGGYVGVV